MNRLKLVAVIGSGLAAAALCIGSAANAAEGAKQPQISGFLARPLKDAQDAMKAMDYNKAIAKLKEAQAKKGNKTPWDDFVINVLFMQTYDKLHDRADEAPVLLEAAKSQYATPEQAEAWRRVAVGIYFQQKNYDKTIEIGQEAIQHGGSQDIYATVALAQEAQGKYKDAAQTIQKVIDKQSKPSENFLVFQWNAYNKIKDEADAAKVIDKLVTYYPKPDYWLNALHPLLTMTISDAHVQMEVFRLMDDVGVLKQPQDFAMMAQLSFDQGYPGETVAVLQEAFQKKVFTDQRDVLRYQHLLTGAMQRATQDQAGLPAEAQKAQSAATGDALVAVGQAYLSYGQPEKAAPLIQAGIAKGGLKYPEEATLLLGIAQLRSHNMAGAHKAFDKVAASSNPSYAQLGKLWTLRAAGAQHAA
jgi:tetratricopeptide (TPR) repeat protein